ncbi:ribosomal L7Ae/L30e/S12e/Gadd45 family protein [Paenibacillus sp. F411]|uniref:50S ribosomal protein L7Ae family protein n=1 Tax=Paenibacillus algicola TaxID=2565926 RepID=A0A4P8XNI8_9BACL|nr:ribosomal L7Ae/L30e/S12e/Gadd45 family protein [Paenibacillus algicola]MBO2945825.1 ribosomal L7Ae/L30e/S12e/Gadd45 family protein [Paenibacillus sp. F411]QCT04447.1 50S ribosomal protein L7Ae family protein [Paenibacillus algicola]
MSGDKKWQDAQLKIGTKQTMKAVENGQAAEVYVAEDCDKRLITKIVSLCQKHGVDITYVPTTRQLGEACGIEVGAAMSAVLKS